VVCTALHSFAMPFIRYSLGDLARRGPDACPCGSRLPTLEMVVGRRLDAFALADGRWLHPYQLIELLYAAGMDWVGQYQLVQEAQDHVRLLVRPKPGLAPRRLESLRQAMQERCGPQVRAEILLVDDIPLASNGKYRVSYSKLGQPGRA
jgi:phenylacetate-CoA ligase